MNNTRNIYTPEGFIIASALSEDRDFIKSFIDDQLPCLPIKIRTKTDLRPARGFGKRSE